METYFYQNIISIKIVDSLLCNAASDHCGNYTECRLNKKNLLFKMHIVLGF